MSDSPCGLSALIEYHFFSEPGPRNNPLPYSKSFCILRNELSIRLAFFFVVSWSTGIVVEHRNEDDPSSEILLASHLFSKVIDFLTELQRIESWEIFHSNSIGSPSILSKFLYSGELLNQPNLSSHALSDWGFSCILPRHNTESEKTCTFVRWRLITLSSPIKDKYFHECFYQPIVSTPEISSLLRHQYCRYVEHLFQCEVSCIRDGMTIVQVFLSHEYCLIPMLQDLNILHIIECFSSFSAIFIKDRFCFFSHLIMSPRFKRWSGSHWQFWFCFIVSNDELLWPCFSLRVHNGLSRSIIRFFLSHNNVLGLLMKETWLGLVWSLTKEVTRSAPFLSSTNSSAFHSWEDQALSSSHPE